MGYYISRTIESGFDEAVADVVDALKREGFSILTDIDVAATMKQKLGIEFRPPHSPATRRFHTSVVG